VFNFLRLIFLVLWSASDTVRWFALFRGGSKCSLCVFTPYSLVHCFYLSCHCLSKINTHVCMYNVLTFVFWLNRITVILATQAQKKAKNATVCWKTVCCRKLHELDILRSQTINLYASSGKVYFRKMLSTTLTFKSMTFKMSSLSCGSDNE